MLVNLNTFRIRRTIRFRFVTLFPILFFYTIALTSIAQADPKDFNLPDLDGVKHKLSDYRGKWVVVNYWATWCPPCLKEIPDLIEFHEAHKDKDAIVIGVDFEDISKKELREFVDSYFIEYPILRQKPAARSDLGAISGLPTSFLISPQGEVVARQTGPVSAKMIEDFISKQAVSQVP